MFEVKLLSMLLKSIKSIFQRHQHVHLRRVNQRNPYLGVPTKLAQTAVRISLDDDNDMGQGGTVPHDFQAGLCQDKKSEIARFNRLNNKTKFTFKRKGMTLTYSEIMVRYGELSTKGKNRMRFINKLRNNIKRCPIHLSS